MDQYLHELIWGRRVRELRSTRWGDVMEREKEEHYIHVLRYATHSINIVTLCEMQHMRDHFVSYSL